jgi:predicted permease
MARVSPGYFEAFGVAPILGRSFRDGEDRDGREKVVVLSERMWASRFGRDRSVVGTTLVVNDAPYEVVGVVPASFDQPSMAALRTESGEFDGRPELWLPLVFVRPASTTGFTILSAIGSLSPDAGAEQASAELTARLPPLPNGRPNQGFVVTPLAQFMTQPIVPAMRIFEFAVALVFLIACANVTNLALARATQLRGELGCRLALGASRGDLLRQTCAELGVLSLAGSATGVALASLCLTLVTALPPETLPRVREVSAAPVMFVFAGALSGVAALSTAAFVTWRVLQSDPIASMRHSAAKAARVTSRPSSVLVVAQIAAATVLLSGAALLLASFASLARSDRGYDPRGLVSFNVSLPRGRYATAAAQRAFYDSVVNRLTQAPGVDRVGVGQTLPFVPRAIGSPTLIDGRRIDGVIAFSNVGARFFSAVGVTVVAGREFDVRDTAVSERVAVIDDEFARMYFAGTDPLGHVVGFMEWPPARIVGVIRTPKGTLAAMRANYPAIYFPMTQLPAPTSRMPETAWLSAATIAVHTSEDFGAVAAAIRTIVRDLDPLVPVYDILPVEQRMADGIISQRFYGYASTLCAIVAGLLAAVGLYGVIAYSVAARRHEFGIRVAVGASSRTIAALVQRSGLVLVTSGVLIGAFGAWAVDGLLASLLHGVQPHDLRFLVAVAVLVVAVGAGACYLPARAATKIDPVRALNS